jgi:hypothetical protein
MSGEGSDTPASGTDTGYFTDADALDTGLPGPVADPNRPPPVDTVDGPGTPAEPGDDAREGGAEVRAALAGDKAATQAFERLVRSGRAAGELLAHLAELATSPRAPELVLNGIDPGLVLSQVVRHLDNPLRVSQGYGRGTCGAATMEYVLLRSYPAELVRLVDGLTGIEQKAITRSGAEIELPPSAIPRDDSGRVDVDRLVQSALMNHASTFSWLFDYDNTKDHDDFWSEINGDSRVLLGGYVNLFKSLVGASYTGVSVPVGQAEALVRRLVADTARGERIAVITSFTAPTRLHWLTVEKIADGPEDKRWVYLRNPWGHDDGAGPPPRWPLPEGGGRIGMEYDNFTALLHGAVVRG